MPHMLRCAKCGLGHGTLRKLADSPGKYVHTDCGQALKQREAQLSTTNK